MIGCRVTSISASGVRQVLIRLRLASASACAQVEPAVRGGLSVSASTTVGRGRASSVMPRPPRSFVVAARCPVRVKNTSSRLGRCRESSVTAMPAAASRRRGRRAARASSCDGHAQRAAPVRLRRGAGDLGEDRGRACSRSGPGRSGGPQRLAADDPLEPVRGVVRDDPAVVDHGDLVGERVGLVQVLRGEQHRRAVGDQAADDVPHVLALGRVEAGGRLVEEDHRRAGRRGRRRGRAAGACRRSRSWPSAPAASVRSNHSSSSRARARASRLGRSSSWPISTRFCSAGQVLVDRGVLAGQADRLPHLLRRRGATSKPGDAGRSAVGGEQRGEDAHGGRLAGAVRPEHAEHGALADGEVDAGQRLRGAEALGEALGLDGVGVCCHAPISAGPLLVRTRTARWHVADTRLARPLAARRVG